MSFEPPEGILDIGNATLRVGKLEVAETSGLNQGLQNIIKNDLLITENNESSPYTTNQKWGLKLPTTWVAEFEVKGQSGKYIDFNFYNENSASNALGYNLTFMDTTMTLRYDGGNPLGGGAATIPTIVGAYRKVNIFFERGVISVSIDGTRYLYHKETDGFNQDLGVASRVVSATGSAFVNLFIEQNADDSAFKNLRIVNGRFISDKTSNIAFIGGNLGVGVNSPKESLDIRGNMHLTRVSNVSQIKVDSNVVTEYTGPHDRPLRKYPEVAMTSASQGGYVVTQSNEDTVNSYFAYKAFNEIKGAPAAGTDIWYSGGLSHYNTSDGSAVLSGSDIAPRLDTNTDYGEWIGLELPKPIKLDSFKLWRQFNFQNHHPVSATLYAKKTSSDSWTEIYRYDDIDVRQGDTPGQFNVNSQIFYKFFAFVGRKRSQGVASVDGISLAELEFYGHEEGSGSLDTTLKTVYNVPATTGTQLEVYYDGRETSSYPESGVTVTDISPNTNNGTLNGGVGFDSTYKAFTFDGSSSQNITSSALGFTGDQPHTFSFWIKDNEMNHTSTYVMHIGRTAPHAASQNSSIEFRSDRIRWASYANDIEYPITGITSNTWYHITGSYIGGGATPENKSLYINGKRFNDTGYNIFSGWEATAGDALSFQSDAFVTLGSSTAIGDTHFTGSIANFRLYSKALNAGQVKELYDYQKDYFLGSKSQVTLYKGHLGVGVTEPSGQLELAGDERLQEYPPGPLGPSTSYETHVPGHGVFCWDTVNYYPGSPNENYNGSGMYAKDGATTGWYGPYQGHNGYTGGNVYAGTDFVATSSSGLGFNDAYGTRYYGAWTTFKLPYKINLKKLHIDQWATSDSVNARCAPEDGVILGSNNGSDWYPVHTFTGLQYGGSAGNPSYSAAGEDVTITCTTDYSQYALVVTRTLHYAFTAMIGELRWFGTPGPTTLDKGSLTLGRSLDVPRISRYDVDTETPRPGKLVLDYDTTIHPFHGKIASDRSGRGNDAFAQNQAIYSATDKAYKFDGSGDVLYCNIPTGNSWGANGTGLPTGDAIYTVSCWVKTALTQPETHPCLIYFGSAWTSNQLAGVYLHDGNKLGHDIGSTGVYTTNQVITAEKWHHVVVVKRGTGNIGANTTYQGIFVDGVEITQLTINGSPRTQALGAIDHITIGGSFYGSMGSFSESLNGLISKPQIWNVALENSEVKKLYNLGRTGRSMILADTSLQIGAGNHSSIFGGPTATLDVHGSAHVSGKFHSMEGNFHRMLGFARGGGHIDHHRTDNCLVAMAGTTVVNTGHAYISFVLRKSGNWMPFFVEVYHCGVNTNSSSLFERRAWVHGRIYGTSVDAFNSANNVSFSASDLGGDLVRFRIFINREGVSYGVSMAKMSYYYGIKGRMD